MAQVETGSTTVFDHYADQYMWTGSGPRSVSKYVKFAKPGNTTPKVSAALAVIDADHAYNLRVAVAAQDVDEKGFNMVASTWGDTKLATVHGSWIAIWP